MDSFRQPFESHFHSEISTIAALSTHPSCPSENSPEDVAGRLLFKRWGKGTIGIGDVTDAVPFFLLNLDATFEDGKWASWPPIPAPIRWGMLNLGCAWNGGWWKFASCGADGRPRELWAMQPPAEK